MRQGADPHALGPVLADLLGVPVELSELGRHELSLRELPNLAGPPDDPSVAVYLTDENGRGAQILLLFPLPDARALGDLMLGEGAGAEAILDACREVGNVIAGRFLSDLADRESGRLTPTTPVSTVDMAGAVISSVLANSPKGTSVLSLGIRMHAADRRIGATLILMRLGLAP